MSYWRICLNGGMLCRKTCVMERNTEWRIYCKDGGHVSWVDIYFGKLLLQKFNYFFFFGMLRFDVCAFQE